MEGNRRKAATVVCAPGLFARLCTLPHPTFSFFGNHSFPSYVWRFLLRRAEVLARQRDIFVWTDAPCSCFMCLKGTFFVAQPVVNQCFVAKKCRFFAPFLLSVLLSPAFSACFSAVFCRPSGRFYSDRPYFLHPEVCCSPYLSVLLYFCALIFSFFCPFIPLSFYTSARLYIHIFHYLYA